LAIVESPGEEVHHDKRAQDAQNRCANDVG